MTHFRHLLALAVFSMIPACSTAVTRESFVPIPDHPGAPAVRPHLRGFARSAEVLGAEDQIRIMAVVVRRFYRPMMQQARWIDPRPLAHERTRAADTVMAPAHDRAIAIVDAARVDRVCTLTGGNARCRGLGGGVLRFSPAYAVGTQNSRGADTALVYVRYSPVSAGVESEIEFLMTRTGDDWRVVSKRTMPEIIAELPRLDELSPQEALDSLLAVDRAFAAAARDTTLVPAITRMFVDNVFMQAPGGFVRGRDSAAAALRANAENLRAQVEWAPIKGGIASDGRHGFTAGYMTVTRPDGTTQSGKYLAYWVRSESGWRVAAYKRSPRAAGTAAGAMLPPTLPVRGLPRGDEATIQRYADELSLAEHAFSRDAQPMGLGPAFAKWGAPDAINAGGPNDAQFIVGPEAIARSVSAGLQPGTTITWAPDRVIVSSTGDLGVSIGTIRITPAGATQSRDVPFFTIWKRAYPTDPWRYVAE